MTILAVCALFVAVETAVLVLLLRQYGRTLLRQDELSGRLSQLEKVVHDFAAGVNTVAAAHAPLHAATPDFVGLPTGALAPDFDLPDLEGQRHHLADFLGKPLLLIFFSPQCGFCLEMAPALGRLPHDGPRVLLISRGNPDEHRRMAAEHGWQADVLLEPDWQVAQAYQANGTPTGYLLDAEGHIASNLLVGADTLLQALEHVEQAADGLTAEILQAKQQTAAERARAAGLPVRESRINREGLPAGTPAPDFTLPGLDNETHSLREFRGRKVLLVFSDPQCGPCQALAPDLEAAHQRTRDLQVLMVSRGDPASNREKVAEHHLTFPVLLQRHWEISAAYGLYATPVGYLIDEEGVIVREPAIGADAILSAAQPRQTAL